jgi:hypothetical protein
MPIEIKQRRIVEDKEGHKHRGQHASLAMDEDGYRAWGFGDSEKEADKDACSNAREVRKL